MRRWFLLFLLLWTIDFPTPVKGFQQPTIQAWLTLVPEPHAYGGGRLALARLSERRLGVLADPDERRVQLLDLDAGRVIASTPFPGRPEAVLVAKSGSIWAIDRDSDLAIELGLALNQVLVERRRIVTAPEPVGLGISPDGRVLFVASRGDAVLERISLASPAIRSRTPSGIEPRGVTVLDDGTPVVGHASTRLTSKGPPFIPMPKMFARTVRLNKKLSGPMSDAEHASFAFDPQREVLDSQEFAPVSDGERAFVAFDRIERIDPHRPGNDETSRDEFGYGGPIAVEPKMHGAVALLGPERELHTQSLPFCSLPRSAAYDRERKLLFVACAGTDRVATIRYEPKRSEISESGEIIVERPSEDFERSVQVPDGPFAVALDEYGDAWVWSEFARAISVVHGETSREVLTIPRSTPDDDVANGRALFHDAGNSDISRAGFACATCHPDGADDGQVWLVKDEVKAADALRQTPTLAGRVTFTDRFGWHGEDSTLDAHLVRTVKRLVGGGMGSAERLQLTAYLRSLGGMRRTHRGSPSLEARGRQLFESEALGCGSCHTDGGRHGGTMGVIREGGPLRSPSLLSVATTGPYLHDGSLETLEEVLDLKQEVLEVSLAPDERNALLAYLVTL